MPYTDEFKAEVKQMHDKGGLTYSQIASILNVRGSTTTTGLAWKDFNLRQMWGKPAKRKVEPEPRAGKWVVEDVIIAFKTGVLR